MRRYIIYLLKHNLVIQFLYRKIFSALFQVLGLFAKTDENLVMFNSMMGTKFNDSPRSIYEYMQAHNEYQNFKCVWVFEDPKKYPELQTVKIDTPKFFWMSLKAKYWISNTQYERGLAFKKKNTKYLYTCHGSAIKLCGNDCPGRKDFDYSRVNLLSVSSKFDEYVLKRAYKAREESFIECGRPCNDRLWNIDPFETEKMREKLGIPLTKKVIFYAPTWRDSQDAGKTYALAPPIDFKKWKQELGDDYVVLFRAHHITTKVMNVEFDEFVYNVSEYPDINDLMIASDILISDYSAVLTDFAILERPIFCFAYDYEDYLKERGTYFDLDEKLPNKSCRTENELLDKLKNCDYEKEVAATRKFKQEFVQYGGNATTTLVKKLFN